MPRMRITLTASLLATLAFAAPAAAESRTVDCLNVDSVPDSSELQNALDQAVTGDTITVAENATCHTPFDEGGFSMPSGQRITLRGLSGATLDGNTEETGVQDRILRGDDVNGSLIAGLLFQHGDASGNGGAIEITGSDPVAIENNVFHDNAASSGGAVFVGSVLRGLQGLRARQLGTDRITIRDNTFGQNDAGNVADVNGGGLDVVSQSLPVDLSGNTFEQNSARQDGGGALVDVCAQGSTIDDNRFAENAVLGSQTESSLHGGGLLLVREFCQQDRAAALAASDFDATQSGNRFLRNRIDAGPNDAAGAGEAIAAATVQSTDDRFVGNKIDTSNSEAELEGGGLAFLTAGFANFEARNLVASGNAISDGGEGGGVYFGQTAEMRLLDSTVVGNTAQRGAGLSADCSDRLKLYNGIVFGNTGAGAEIAGFDVGQCASSRAARADGDQLDVRATDACVAGNGGPEPYPGDAANICADPQLNVTADGVVDQTAASPTLDAGDDALVPSDLAKDYAGDGRILDADGADGATVDMGADEFLPPEPEPTPTPEPTPQAQQPAPPAPAAAGGVLGTQQRSCVSRRTFKIRIRVPHGKKALSAVVRVDGKKVKVVRGKRLTAPVRLRGLPKGTFKVKITVRLSTGRKISGTRTYHTCRPHLPGDGPPRV
jgi:Right handed beta helix region